MEGLPSVTLLAASAAELCPAWGPHSAFSHRRAPAAPVLFSTEGSPPAPRLRQKGVVKYDTAKFPFAEAVLDALLFGGKHSGQHHASEVRESGRAFQASLSELGLSKIHVAAEASGTRQDSERTGNVRLPKGNSGRNIMRRVKKVYQRFICEEVAPLVSAKSGGCESVMSNDFAVAPLVSAESGGCESVMYQSIPAFRMVPPSPKQATHAHMDAMYYHQPSQVNFWLPLSRVGGANALWVESEDGKADFAPLDLAYGECARFYGNRTGDGTADFAPLDLAYGKCARFYCNRAVAGSLDHNDWWALPSPFAAVAGSLYHNDWWASRQRPDGGE
ncbi:hypothetical protein T484DRAFT_1913857, partial [Baffinella frigidus]